jgi:hypothetical protein
VRRMPLQVREHSFLHNPRHANARQARHSIASGFSPLMRPTAML